MRVDKVLVYGSVAPDICNACVLHLTGVANALSRQGAQVTLMAPECRDDDPLAVCLDDAVNRETFLWPKLFNKSIWTLGPLFSFRMFVRIINEQRPNLLYVRMGLLTWPLHWYARRKGIESVAEHNGIVAVELSRSLAGRLIRPVAEWFQLLSCAFATKSRAVTEGMMRQLIDLGADGDKIFVMGNGTDVENLVRLPRAESLSRLGLSKDGYYIGFLGSLSWWQGVHTLIEACHIARKSIPNLHLLIGGDGSEMENLAEQVRVLRMEESVTFMGYVDHGDRQAVLSAMDIATLPACAQRNMEQGVSPLKVRDYAAVGSVILAADLPGLESMSEAEALVLHKPDNPEDLAEMIKQLHDNPERRKRLADNSRAFAERHFSWNLIGGQLLEVLGMKT